MRPPRIDSKGRRLDPGRTERKDPSEYQVQPADLEKVMKDLGLAPDNFVVKGKVVKAILRATGSEKPASDAIAAASNRIKELAEEEGILGTSEERVKFDPEAKKVFFGDNRLAEFDILTYGTKYPVSSLARLELYAPGELVTVAVLKRVATQVAELFSRRPDGVEEQCAGCKVHPHKFQPMTEYVVRQDQNGHKLVKEYRDTHQDPPLSEDPVLKYKTIGNFTKHPKTHEWFAFCDAQRVEMSKPEYGYEEIKDSKTGETVMEPDPKRPGQLRKKFVLEPDPNRPGKMRAKHVVISYGARFTDRAGMERAEATSEAYQAERDMRGGFRNTPRPPRGEMKHGFRGAPRFR